jgi:hypothetical protein
VATATPIQPQQQRKQRAHAKPETTRTPLALWHLLSLDAPTVATLWTSFVASANRIHLPASSILAMAVAVWMLYAADRLLDARLMDAYLRDARLPDTAFPHEEGLEARHHFHHQHRTFFLTGILLASIALAVLLPRLESAALHLYLILGGLLAGYFILIHAAPRTASNKAAHRLPKEIAVGVFFASAIFIPTVARRPDLRFTLLPAALLFAAVCSLNCLFIYAWEHAPNTLQPNLTAHITTRLALRNLPSLAVTAALIGLALTLLDHSAPWHLFAASTLAIAILLTLHTLRHNIPPTTLRSAADLALLTPLLLLLLRR